MAHVQAAPSNEEGGIVSDKVNKTFGLWFPFFRWMTMNLPPVWVARLAQSTAERAIWDREHVRDAILDNYARVLELPRNHRRVEDAALTMISSHSRFWIDLLRYSGRKDFDASKLLVSRVGDESVLQARKEGRGAILLTAHVGNFELGGLFLSQLGIDDVFVVYAPDPSPVIEAHREKARQLLHVRGIPVTRSPFAFVPILQALEKNAVVAIQGDRDIAGTGRRLPLFGEPTSFPEGPFQIAAASGAPIFPSFVLQTDDGHYRSVILPPIRVTRIRDRVEREAEIVRAMTVWVETMASVIREHPTQWYHFQRYWEL